MKRTKLFSKFLEDRTDETKKYIHCSEVIVFKFFEKREKNTTEILTKNVSNNKVFWKKRIFFRTR